MAASAPSSPPSARLTARDLTARALDLGYADHRDFTNAFRHERDEPPSSFRARVKAH
jgi:AraC-like DNA-binding protein